MSNNSNKVNSTENNQASSDQKTVAQGVSKGGLDPKQTKAYLKELLQPYKKQTNKALIVATVSMLLFIVQSYVLAQIFADWLVAVSTKQPLTMTVAKQYLPYLALLLLIRPLLALYKNNLLVTLSVTIRQNMRKKLLSAIVSMGGNRHYFGSDGNLSNKVLEQVDALDGFISRFYVQKYIAVLTPLVIIIATAYYSKLASFLMFVTAPLVPIFMILVGSAAADKSREQFQAMAQMSGRFLDLLRGMPTLKRLNATTQATHVIKHSSEQYQNRTMKVLKLAFLSGGVLELFSSLAIALVALYLGLGLLGILPWAKGEIPVAYEGALFILLLAPEFYAPLRQLGSDYHAKANAEGAVAEFYPLLIASEKIAHKENNDKQQITNNTQANTQPINDLLAQSLKQPPSITLSELAITTHDNRVRLAPTSLQIASKQKIAIIGHSGIGKSSLLQAILGFVPFTGTLQINGQSVNQGQLQQMQPHIGYLAQSSSLLPISIADNLRLAKKQASDDELQAVLKQVELWSLIKQLPQGIDTTLGERGKGLSGGQQQRLAIAQLLLRNASLWLLDEPCSHLDPETASQIFQLLGQLSHDKTVLLVSHDLNNVDWLDMRVNLTAQGASNDK